MGSFKGNEADLIESMIEEAQQFGYSKSRFCVNAGVNAGHDFCITEWPPGTLLAPEKEGLTFGPWCKQYLGQPLPEWPEWSMGAVFAVRNDHILARPLQFYENLLASVSYARNPQTAHFLERAWLYVFGCK